MPCLYRLQNKYRILFVLFISLVFFAKSAWSLNLDKLSDKDIKKVKALIAKLEPTIQKRQAKGTLATLTFDELYAPLNKHEKSFLKKFRNLDAKELNVRIPYQGIAKGNEGLAKVKSQWIKVNGEGKELPLQFVPETVFESFNFMMDAMEKVIGKRLYIESGYRSSAYQLYLFVYYLKNHDYSVRETVKFVALPGYSEHGAPGRQALDFINQEGINGEDDPKKFEELPEYTWLKENADKYGFVLSYPKDSGSNITYEPWHWHYEKKE